MAADNNGAGPVFGRVLLKLSGEALMGDQDYGVDLSEVELIAREIEQVHEHGVQIAIVVGAGNIYRGMTAAAEGMDRATADYAGMLATVLNALTLQDVLELVGGPGPVPVHGLEHLLGEGEELVVLGHRLRLAADGNERSAVFVHA